MGEWVRFGKRRVRNSSPLSPNSPRSPNQLPKEVISAGWISLFTDIASEMAYPVIPLFLVGVLKAPASALGLIEGVAQALINVMRAVSGWHSDRIGKRTPYIRLGYGISALSRPLLAFAGAWPFVLFARLLDRFGKGVRTTARDALIADVAKPGQAGRAFGFHRAMDSAGAVIGSGSSWLLLAVLPGQYRLIFLITAIPAAIAVWIAFRLKEPEKRDLPELLHPLPPPPLSATEARAPKDSSHGKEKEGVPELPRSFWLATLVMSLFALANSSDTFLLLRAQDLVHSASMVALLYVLYNIAYTLLSYPLGALSDRIGTTTLIVAGWFLYAAVYYGFSLNHEWMPWLLMPTYGIYMAMTDGVSKALVAKLSPVGSRGTAMGIFYVVTGGAALLASVVAGMLWDRVDHQAPFLFGAVVAAISAVLALIILPNATSRTKLA